MQNKITLVGIDLAKDVFWVRAEDEFGRGMVDKKVTRNKLFEQVTLLRPEVVAMEACGGAHYWARRFATAGITVKMIAPQFVKPFRRGDKNDRNDSQAICEASKRPGLRSVRVKTIEQQHWQRNLRLRESAIQRRTQVINEGRSFLLEFGIVMPLGRLNFLKVARELLSDNEIESSLQEFVIRTLQNLERIDEDVHFYDDKIRLVSKTDPICKSLTEVAGVGPVTAVALRTGMDPGDFKNGRQMAAFIGLVPRQNSSGGKTKLFGIGKDGNRYLRQLLIHGARSVLIRSKNKTDSINEWASRKWQERGFNKACVALANKNARMLWAVMAKTAQLQQAV